MRKKFENWIVKQFGDNFDKKLLEFDNKDHEDEFQARFKKMGSVFEKIPDFKAKHPNGGNGQIECPACKGILRYSIARTNKHIHMRCSTKGCISMME